MPKRVRSGCFGGNCRPAGPPLACHGRNFAPRSRHCLRGLCGATIRRVNLPGVSDTLDTSALGELVAANQGRRGFTYTHKPLSKATERKVVKSANAAGFTINLSGNNPSHADTLADLDCGPVVTVLPGTVQGNVEMYTPAGRRVVVCPATYREDVSCATCGLCSRANRKTVVGFPVHGTSHKRAAAATQNLG